ncbi:MAG: substrate-binding domain-containing protein [Clostridiales bacterium]|nr:substrate-binding domain-containing protein [Clostridiales bacterium]
MAEKVTLAKIAEACQLSVGTVSRALNDRSDISKETKSYVARIAKELGYQKIGFDEKADSVRIGMVYCKERADFYDEVTLGIRKAAQELGEHVKIDLLQTQYLDQAAQTELLSSIDIQKYNGLVINAAGSETGRFINQWIEQGIPIATFNTDIPSGKRLFYVGCSAYIAGQMGAHLLGKLIGQKGKIALLGSSLEKTAWVDRFSSAYAVFHQDFPEIEICPVFHESLTQKDIYLKVLDYLSQHPDINGILPVNGTGTCSVIQALQKLNRKDIHMVGFDMAQEARTGVQDGYCDALLYQEPFRQGYLAVMNMVNYLMHGILPSRQETTLMPQIIMKYNLEIPGN